MNAIDIQNAFEPGRNADNFTVLLLRLIAKSDSENREKLRKGYPVEVRAVEIYKQDCPYADDAKTQVDWDEIDLRANDAVGATGEFPDGKANEDDEGELRLAIGIDKEKKLVVMDFGKSVRWLGMTPSDARGIAAELNVHANQIGA